MTTALILIDFINEIVHESGKLASKGYSDFVKKNNQIDSILVAGVATDLAVSNFVRDAHDRDYNVTILEDCCAAANNEDHETALLSLRKLASVKNSKEAF